MDEIIDELLDYFQMNTEEEDYPRISIYYRGQFIEGNISDELYGILVALKESKENSDE